ncbi:hypothetical protein ACP_3045 [Acidobacterium capsulatum ATCC 51196]|uniref:Uncharacterized protein n=1 Tax=Acidobacterium capsulatum (strain ATCC 51196 / DSM 11244 / BCRC 80197 / JCM 7670 / NBRC 15755 / NCIMB 13165 / 161) TaxID=240015 RepID=C1F4K2_ACIC5|nr:hypothetical protein ACP_3045 [Acidobacterium capsulatum ATCC 51196]
MPGGAEESAPFAFGAQKRVNVNAESHFSAFWGAIVE